MTLQFEDFDRREFQEFHTMAVEPPRYLSEKIQNDVYCDLHPSAWKVFSKLSFIHFSVGLVTLSICPQFGFRLLGNGMGLMGSFMNFGPYGCMVACGSFFVGSSILVASLILRSEEVRKLRKNSLLGVSALALLSIGFFIMLDADIVFGYALAWIFGSTMTGITLLQVAYVLRFKFKLALHH